MSTQNNTHSDAIILMKGIGQKARAASRAMARASTASKNEALIHLAALVRKNVEALKLVNAKDVERAKANGQDAAFIDRLTLTDKTIATMAEGLEQIGKLSDPIGEMSNIHINSCPSLINYSVGGGFGGFHQFVGIVVDFVGVVQEFERPVFSVKRNT